jgi:hypothetical protein
MRAQRVTVISAFAGGCLCTALIGFWKSDTAKQASVTVSERRASLFVAPLEAEPDAASEIRAEPVEPSATVDDGTDEGAGTSVADVLSRLETAYRIVSAAKALETEEAIEPPNPAPGPAEPAPEARAELVVPAPVATPEPSAEPAPPASVAAAPVELPPAISAAVSAPVAAPATYVGEVNNNIHVGDVHVGDRYDVQQLAMIQYLQLLALSSLLGGHAPVEQRFQTPARPRAPITVIPNPDNPWGFNFPPPALVK